jgi:hypothetical protein
MNLVKSVRTTTYIRSWGYAAERPLTPLQEQKLASLLDRYHEVQDHNLVTELEVDQAVLGRAVPFSQLTVAEANQVASHLLVRIALHTHFRNRLPDPAPDFAGEVAWLSEDRELADRVISRAGWDTAEYFMPAHPTHDDVPKQPS